MLNQKKVKRPRRSTRSSAVTWLNGRQALVTQIDGEGRIRTAPLIVATPANWASWPMS